MGIFVVLLLASLTLLVVGLAKPSLILRWGSEKFRTRGFAALVFGFATLLSFVLIAITAPRPESSPATPQSNEALPDIVVNSEILVEPKPEVQKTTPPTPTQQALYKVVYVVDGDTLEIDGGQRVRLVGIDSPERGQPFYAEARNKLSELVLNKSVRIEKDITDIDRYGRLLRYIYVGNLFVNLEMVRLGYASSYTYPPDVKYQDQILAAQKEAQNTQLGIWAPQPILEPLPQPKPQQTDIICSYNAYNCSDFSTHAEAQNVYEYCGGINNDVHKLDRDKDELACESLP